jgi:SH3 domain-containing YSC84-like protein 1
MIKPMKMFGSCFAAAIFFPAIGLAQVENLYGENPTYPEQYQRGRMKDAQMEWQNNEQLIRDATQVFKQLTMKETRRELAEQAKCIVIFPTVTEAALAIGVRTSNGIASCKGPGSTWSQVSFVDMTGATLGVQIGGKSTQVVMYLMNDRAKEALAKGHLTLGADLSYALGSQSGEISAESTGKDVTVVADSSGVFAGASLSGTSIEADHSAIRSFYGKDTPNDILLGTFESTDRSEAVSELKKALSS